MKKIIGVYGASGFGREVMPIVREQFPDATLSFIDDGESGHTLNGYQVESLDSFSKKEHQDKSVVIAIADSKIRYKLAQKVESYGLKQVSIFASNVVSLDAVDIGEASILCPFVTLTSNIQIGRGFHANIYSYVAHDCIIGDYVTFAHSVKCNGNVHIEDHAYIGTGAIIKQGTPDKPVVIGEGAIVGMGAVVTKSVEPGSVVIGNPAKPLKKS